jgi:suppressor of G2 allele of SKP1
VKKDWYFCHLIFLFRAKIDREIELDIEKNKEAYGEDPLNGLFRQIYQNGNEETKKAMIKSM